MTLSVRNNNPLNIRPTQPYEGLATPSSVSGFANFIGPVWGFRAVFRNYITKADRGVDTVRKLITEWSPPADNTSPNDPTGEKSTAAYIASVCKSAGFGPDDTINLKAWDTASRICYAQTIVESGQPFETNWKQSDMAEGAMRAGIMDAPKTPLRKAGVIITGSASAVSTAAPYIVDTINTYHPIIDQSHNELLKTVFGIAAGVFALLTIFNHMRSAK